MNNHCRNGERGLSLVELMIAMTIGLILLAGVYQVFISSSLSYKYQEDISRLQENARMAMDQLAQDVRQAGSPRFTTDEGQTFATASGGAAPVTTGASGGTASDTIAVAYLNDAGVVERVSYAVNADLELTRQTQIGAALPSGFQPIIDGVENMQIVYGVDTTNDDSVDAYVDTPGAGENMISVRIRLLMRTVNEQPKADLDTRVFDVNGDGVGEVDPVDDRRMRQIFTTTITLRNRLR